MVGWPIREKLLSFMGEGGEKAGLGCHGKANSVSYGWYLLMVFLVGLMSGAIAPDARAEDWEFFASGSDSYRHYIDMDSIEWDVDDPAIASARFSSNRLGEVYRMTHFCDPDSPNYDTYLLGGYANPVRLETVVESARTILCFSPCHSYVLPTDAWIPERTTELAGEFWSQHSCPR